MKVLHLPVAYLPWTVGGREVYCHSLCRALSAHGVESIVAINQNPNVLEELGSHEHEGIQVYVLPPIPGVSSRISSYTKTYSELPGFSALLERLQPDLVHFHDQGGGASLSHLREVKRRGIPALFTYHTPGQSCPQKELLRFGKTPCDGKVTLQRCTACRLTVSGLPKPISHLLALTEWPGVNPLSTSKISRVLSGRTMTRLFRESLDEFFNLADAGVVHAEWAREVLLRNSAPASKLHFIRTGGRESWSGQVTAKFPERFPLRIACLGRCTQIKGVHVLVDAVKALPEEAPVEVHFLGPYWNSDAYGLQLQRRIDGDRRFVAPRLIPNADLLGVLAEMDVVAIPSLWLETGPLTVFDAFAAGIPVIGSRLGGIAELVRESENGWLFEAGASEELTKIIKRLLTNPDDYVKIQQQVKPIRTMETVALEHLPLYRALSHGG